MQKAIKDFDVFTDNMFNAIGVSTAIAEKIMTGTGLYVYEKDTDYRGDVLICDVDKQMAIGFVELVSCEINEMEPPTFSWKLINPRRIIELPCVGIEGVFSTCYEKGDITPYPTDVELDITDTK